MKNKMSKDLYKDGFEKGYKLAEIETHPADYPESEEDWDKENKKALSLLGQQQYDYLLEMTARAKAEGHKEAQKDELKWLYGFLGKCGDDAPDAPYWWERVHERIATLKDNSKLVVINSKDDKVNNLNNPDPQVSHDGARRAPVDTQSEQSEDGNQSIDTTAIREGCGKITGWNEMKKCNYCWEENLCKECKNNIQQSNKRR